MTTATISMIQSTLGDLALLSLPVRASTVVEAKMQGMKSQVCKHKAGFCKRDFAVSVSWMVSWVRILYAMNGWHNSSITGRH
eukprot:1146530-Pelagomonas_calceolata.AAC.2